MSGIVGLVNLDGAPVDRDLLARMTSFLAFRGPDAQETWCNGSVGFGHAMLRTTFEAERERQPCSLDGEVWLTADARVDARDDLKRELEAAGRRDVKDATDAELILHAYHAWGERCVEHLLGDFAFAIWDGPQRRLFCARDHFGVKPFYYARVGGSFIFSNTLNCVRLHPGVSSDLNELAIADFLLFGWNQEPATTVLRDVQCLPAAHTLVAEAGGYLRLRRYWELRHHRVERRRREDHVEEFLEVLEGAVRDRLRTKRVAVFMSGGLDSSSVAATACLLLKPLSETPAVRPCVAVYDQLVPDEERQWSGLVAEHLHISNTYLPSDGFALFEHCDDLTSRPPQPVDDPLWVRALELYRLAAADDRVLLTGEGADACLKSPASFQALARDGRLVSNVIGHWRSTGRPPGFGLRSRMRRLLGSSAQGDCLPTWLESDFVERCNLRSRWAALNAGPVSAGAREAVTNPFWPTTLFPSYSPEYSRQPLDARHPFFDCRVVSFLLTVPPFPWLHGKELLRVAMTGRLPHSVRHRPKARVHDPAIRKFESGGYARPEHRNLTDCLSPFVRSGSIRRIINGGSPPVGSPGIATPEVLRILALGQWLATA